MYKFTFTRIRVDLGEEAFASVEINEELQNRWGKYPELKQLCKEMMEFIKSRSGQVVENNNGEITFDTSDLTVFGQIEREDDKPLSNEDLDLIAQLIKG